MEADKSSYRQIFKATSLFGGVQVFNVIISIVRSKFVAVLLGPNGMGITGLLTSTTGFINNLTNFGIGTSAVKSVAQASGEGNQVRIAQVVSVMRRLVWITGFLGMIITALLSPWLSQLTFKSHDFTIAFVLISITLLFQQLNNGQIVLLQGLRKLRFLAKSDVIGAVLGLIFTVPIYYVWGKDGIVPVIILTSLITLVLSWFYSAKVGIKSIKVSREILIKDGGEMIRMGFLLSLSGLITIGSSYVIRIYISNTGSIDHVGLYNAGFAIITTYVGMVFTAMGTDYYPRLSEVAFDNQKARKLINQQAEIAILILSPILSVFLIFVNWVIILFYSNKFISINGMIYWAALGMYFKAAAWSIGYIFLAKGASKLFFWNELVGNCYILGFNIAGYKFAGLEGLGISFLAAYAVFFIQVLVIAKVKYDFSFRREFYTVAGLQLLTGLICFGVTKTVSTPVSYLVGLPFIVFSVLFSFKELDKRLEIKSILLSKLKNA